MRKGFLLTGVFVLSALLGYGAGSSRRTIDSLNAAARRAYDTSFSMALALSSSASALAEGEQYTQGILASACLRATVWTNTNESERALATLYGLSPAYVAVDPALFYAALGTCWFSRGNYDSARSCHSRALAALSPSRQPAAYANECLWLAMTYTKTGSHGQALEYYDQAVRKFSTLKDSAGLAWCEDAMGEIFYAQRLYDKARAHFLHSCQAFHGLRNFQGEASALLDLGNNYYLQVRDDSARWCYNTALGYCIRLGDSSGMAICYSNLSRIFLEARNTRKAIDYAQKALSTIRPGNYISLEAGTYQQLGDIYGEMQQYPIAISYVSRALAAARAGDNKVIVRDCYKSLSELYASMGRHQQAWQNLLSAYRLKDSIEPVLYNRRLAEMDAKYKAEKKEAEIRGLKQQGLIDALKMRDQHNRLQLQGYLLLLLVVILAASAVVVYYRNARRRLLEQIQREKMVKDTEERERMRIARDIHDELGSGLSKIRFLSEHVQAAGMQGVSGSLVLITETSRGLIDNMRDLVWAMNPENTTLDSLVARIREYAGEYLEELPIELEYDIPAHVPRLALSKEVTRNLFMIVKESLQNTVKHAGATHVRVRVCIDRVFTLEITDNGRGFDTSRAGSGNGVRNIRARAHAAGATLSIISSPGQGTRIKLDLALPVTAVA